MQHLKWFVVPDIDGQTPIACEDRDHAMAVHAMLGEPWFLDGVDTAAKICRYTAVTPGNLRTCEYTLDDEYSSYLLGANHEVDR